MIYVFHINTDDNEKLIHQIIAVERFRVLGRSVITMHIQKLYVISMPQKTSILSCRTNEQIVFYTKSPMTYVFLNAKLAVLCFIFTHEVCFVFF
jgi:hypothetical protein